ncbi:efflux RND transporter permease subunit [Paraglaciecola hydrolytica]|uniref:Acriflavine resistance protein B n=1 Tax=Paraglaciecola hydrolytica TaxID=1799789 RepID=A0A136A3E0_9ALTE|nr:efflux RND transporter permease subunit [Paraglaciecola hydrolytica]KXI29724.1 acriflavine resistance protein B [Paraglaciecola hydrolytica]
MSQSLHSTSKSPWFSVFFRNGHLLSLSIMVILVAGLSAVMNLPRLEDPRIDTRNALVITPYNGASAERVEALVTDVIEDELRQLFEIHEIRSTSRSGISVITLELQARVDNTNNEQIFSKIRQALGNASQKFPQGAGSPLLDERRGATSFTMLLALKPTQGYATPMTMVSRMADELADRVRNVPGTELVRMYGGLQEEINVTIDPQELHAAGLNIAQASSIVQAADPKVPAGVLRSAGYETRLQVADELDSLERIRQLPLKSDQQGQFLRLGDVAEVNRGWRTPVNDMALVNGEQVVFVAARMQSTVRVDKWTTNAKETLLGFNQQFGATVTAEIVFEQNIYTEQRLSELVKNLLLGCLVVMAVVLLFMGLRASWIVGLSLPLCASFAVFSLSFYGEQIHQMSIFGIIIAIGLLIDNAIVITDEIRAKLAETAMSRLDALVSSVRHLFVPLLASTLTTILGFMPIFLLPGNIGDFIGSIAISVVMALLGSLFISLSIIAALAARLLPRGAAKEQARWYQQGIQLPQVSLQFKTLLERAIKRPLLGISVTVIFALSGFVLATQLGNVFFPSADRDQFEVYLWMPEGTPIKQTEVMVQDANQFITNLDGVKQITWLVGGSAPSVYYNQVMTRDNSPHFANAVVSVNSVTAAKKLIGELQQSLDAQYPNARFVVRAFGQGPPISAPVGFKILGPDIEMLNQLGEQVRLAMSQVPGISQSVASITLGDSELVLDAKRDNSQLVALSLVDVAQQLQLALDGKVGGSILEGSEEIPIRIRVAQQQRDSLAAVQALPLSQPATSVNSPTNQANWLPVAALGDFVLRPSIAGITRLNGERVNNVEAYLLPDATAIDVSKQVEQKLKDMGFSLPKGYKLKLAGDADKQQEALGQLATYTPVLLVLMITTLILSFSSLRLALVIGTVAILSVGMGMFSLWLSGLPIGFNPLLGCAGLIGVAINGSIVVIAAINANPMAKGGSVPHIVTEVMGCSRHILSTTFTTVGGFIPLLLFSEGTFWPPLAVVLAGGVGFSVILSLIFTPLVIALIYRRNTPVLA